MSHFPGRDAAEDGLILTTHHPILVHTDHVSITKLKSALLFKQVKRRELFILKVSDPTKMFPEADDLSICYDALVTGEVASTKSTGRERETDRQRDSEREGGGAGGKRERERERLRGRQSEPDTEREP